MLNNQINNVVKCLSLMSLSSAAKLYLPHSRFVRKCTTQFYNFSPCLIQYRTKTTKVRRQTFGYVKPLKFDYSGDLVTRKALPDSEIVYRFKELEELEKAPVDVKKLCSIEFASGVEVKEHRMKEVLDRIQLLFGPDSLREQIIARLTVDVRSLIPHCVQFRQDKRGKSILVEKIQMRKKYLKFLRKDDYQRFEWLLDELKIQYIPPPDYYRYLSKKSRRKDRVKLAAYSVRQSKIDALKEKLREEKLEYLKYKENILEDIEKEIETYKLDKETIKSVLIREKVASSK